MKLPVPIDTAVLLAAGRGQRLSPWTDRTPKPLLVHRGRPTLDFALDSLALAGVSRVVLVVHHLAEQLVAYAASRRAATGQEIVCLRQDRLFGTAHALQCVMYARPELLVTPFLLSATDYLVPPTFYGDLLRFHAGHDAALTVSLKAFGEDGAARSSVRFAGPGSVSEPASGPGPTSPNPRPSRGTCHRDGVAMRAWTREGRRARRSTDDPGAREILEIVEKPAPGTAPSALAANLCFVLPPELLEHVGETGVSPRGEREIQTTINAWLAAGGRARGLVQPTPPEWDPEESARF